MAGSVNKVMLIGNLGRDPEVRTTQEGKKLVTFSVATSESWKDRNTGEKRDRTEWHRIVIFNEGLVRISEQYLRKGSKVYIEGQIQNRKYVDQNGVEKTSTEVVLNPFRGELGLLDNRNSNPDSGYPGNSGDQYGDYSNSATAPLGSGGATPIDDDVPPF
jgi:single-strand DNA-binding protein